MYSLLCTVACRRGWAVHSWQRCTVPEKGGVKYVVFIVSEFCQAMAQILIDASVLPVYQGIDSRSEMHTVVCMSYTFLDF